MYKPERSTTRLDVCLTSVLLSRYIYRCLRTELLRSLIKQRAILISRVIEDKWGRVIKNIEEMLVIMLEFIGLEGDPVIL